MEDDRKYLEFIREHNLNTKPLQVDLLVIKKPGDYQMKDEMNEIKASSVTITMIRDAKPEKLLIDLVEEGYTIRSPYKGIYYIESKTNFATQIIVSKELTGQQYVWLKALTKKLDQERARLLVEQAQRRKDHRSRQLVDSVLAAIIRANKELFGRLKEDAVMCEALRELMEDELNESKIFGEKIGEKKV